MLEFIETLYVITFGLLLRFQRTDLWLLLVIIPAFSATCIAAIFRHPSFDIVFRRAV